MKLFTYRFYHPSYRQWQVLDCAAETAELAMTSAIKFLSRENRRLAKISRNRRCQLPRHVGFMRPAA